MGTLAKGVGVQWCDLNLTYDLSELAVPLQLYRAMSQKSVRGRQLILSRDIGWGCRGRNVMLLP